MSARGRGRKPKVAPPPLCARCSTNPAEGSLHVSFDPFEADHDDCCNRPRARRGWSMYLPICLPCVRTSIAVDVKMEVKNDAGGFVTSNVPKGTVREVRESMGDVPGVKLK